MQYTIKLSFLLENVTDELKDSIKEIKTVLATQTIGGNIGQKSFNSNLLKLQVPKLQKKVVWLSTKNPFQEIRHHLVVYNLACSLHSCVITHTLEKAKNGTYLIIEILTESKSEYELIDSIHQRFLKEIENS